MTAFVGRLLQKISAHRRSDSKDGVHESHILPETPRRKSDTVSVLCIGRLRGGIPAPWLLLHFSKRTLAGYAHAENIVRAITKNSWGMISLPKQAIFFPGTLRLDSEYRVIMPKLMWKDNTPYIVWARLDEQVSQPVYFAIVHRR